MKQSFLVSIVIPLFNAEKFIINTLDSIRNQTYTDYEVIIVDDISTDSSVDIVKSYINKYPEMKINLVESSSKLYAAKARNVGITNASGRYLCYLDADDFWDKDKLLKQVSFMQEHDCAFSYTGYEFANSEGVPNGSKVLVPNTINYHQALKNTTIWTSTVMFDLTKLSKELIYMPLVKSEDTASWWKILKTIDKAYGINEILSYYRRSEGTLSSNKFEAIKRIWFLYRKVEKLNIFYSFYCFCFYAFNAVRRRV